MNRQFRWLGLQTQGASNAPEHCEVGSHCTTRRGNAHAVVTAAADHIARRLLDHLMNMNDASCPRMPRIKDLALLGPMGVASSRCTTPIDPTRPSAAGHPTRSMLRKQARRNWRRNPTQNPPSQAAILFRKTGPPLRPWGRELDRDITQGGRASVVATR